VIQLLHLRMHNWKERDFSFRRYCRYSGREICHIVLKKLKSSPMKSKSSPRLERSFSNTFNKIRRKASMASFRRTGSGRGSISSRASSRHSSVASSCEHDNFAGGDEELPSTIDVAYNAKTIQLKFSNYAQIDLKRCGSKSRRRYEYELWGYSYIWKSERLAGDTAPLYYLTEGDSSAPLEHIIPVLQSISQQREEERIGSWVHPCSFWVADRTISNTLADAE
jgi:hypothetical protein